MKIREALAKLGQQGLDRLAASVRLDSWQNNVTGFGTDRDKTTYTAFMGPQYLSDEALSNLYHGDDLAARMVDIVPDEMLREGFSVDLGSAKASKNIAAGLEKLGARKKLANAIRWGRCYGGGALLIGADDGRSASTPLVPERAKGVKYLYELDRRLLFPLTYYTEPGHPQLGEVETYMVTPASVNARQDMAVVHESRLIVFGGATTGIREREINQGWDHSVLQRAFEALRAFNTGWKAVEILLTDGNQAVFKMQGLTEMIGANGQEYARQRMQVIDLYRSVMRAIVIDAGDKDTGTGAESFERHSATFSDIPATLDKFMLRLAAAVQIPVTILMGQSPAGMNATGDSDFRWFYNRIRSQQELVLKPQILRLVTIMLETETGATVSPENIQIEFPSLWSLDPLQEAQRIQALATADASNVNAGIFLPEEVALIRAQPGGYSLEMAISDEARKAREEAVTGQLEQMAAGELEPPGQPAPGGGFGGAPIPEPAAEPVEEEV